MNLNSRIAIAAAGAATLCLAAQATPRAAEASGADYLVSAEDLDGFHIGGYYRYTSREVNHALKEAHRFIYRDGLNRTQALDRVENDVEQFDEIKRLVAVYRNSQRGVA